MRIPIISLLLLFLLSASAQSDPSSPEYDPAYVNILKKNKIKAVHLVKMGDTIESHFYNTEGQLKKVAFLESEFTDEEEWMDYSYNPDGTLDKVVYHMGEYVVITHQYSYEDGLPVRSVLDGAEPREYSYTHENGKVTRITGKTAYVVFDEETDEESVEWEEIEEELFTYADDGRIASYQFLFYGEPYSLTRFYFDKKGQLEKKVYYYGDPTEDPIETVTASYNKGLISSSVSTSHIDETIITINYQYEKC